MVIDERRAGAGEKPMREYTPENITDAVVEQMATTPDPRLKEIMECAVRHLHAFAREVNLTPAEWIKGIEFMTKVGQMCTPARQEFILLSDTLGVSMLVIGINNRKPTGATESTVFGPFYVADAPLYENGDSARSSRNPIRSRTMGRSGRCWRLRTVAHGGRRTSTSRCLRRATKP